ncbi:MAG: hypothetical protein EOO01_00045 [Chitinophagaceae bacterium]|nr:MAG: hypothetical protein EOO01_00045 [Chitinophagaceae bacterium]
MASGAHFLITDVENGTVRFTKPNGSTSHTLSLETIRDIVSGKRDFHSGLGSYYHPLVSLLKKMQAVKSGPKTALKNYVIVIDEINRANISKVFGELITLLEDDKRLGAENSLSVTLPNGELDFAIPPNLYVVGTMNTADKSIALIDIALRRRFEFEGFYPDYDVLAGEYPERVSLLQNINMAIFGKKKTADYLIGHGYLMKDEPIVTIITKKIVPLLMEYFSGRVEEVESIFSTTGIKVKFDILTYNWDVVLPIEHTDVAPAE